MAASFPVVGLMSGTSLDGVDLVWVRFTEEKGRWNFQIDNAITLSYSLEWQEKLKNAPYLPGRELIALDREFGNYLGNLVRNNAPKSISKPLLIASHGHTIFHEPENGFTFQLGSGASIASASGLPVVCDFRSGDVAKGGQGAPLVPLGDKLLFTEYEACLNLGGFSNISFDRNNVRIAFDICPVNIVLNHYAGLLGKKFDVDGQIARTGKLNRALLDKLNSLEFYALPAPKSLGREWLEQQFLPVLSSDLLAEEDYLHTVTHHIAEQIAKVLNVNKINNVLITGGGAHNGYLLEQIANKTTCKLVIPGQQLVDFKEALIFAFLGFLNYKQEINCYASVTGANKDSVLGCMYEP